MNTAQQLATFLGDNKQRGEKLFRLSQVDSDSSRVTCDALVFDITASFKEVFGCNAPWEVGK